jgi:hypothetical protein
MFIDRKALSRYYEPQGVEKHWIEEFGYQSEAVRENLLKQNIAVQLTGCGLLLDHVLNKTRCHEPEALISICCYY